MALATVPCKLCGELICWGRSTRNRNVPLNAKTVTAFIQEPTSMLVNEPDGNRRIRSVQVYVVHWPSCQRHEKYKARKDAEDVAAF